MLRSLIKRTSAIIKRAEETIPKSAGRKFKESVPWWDGKCSKAIEKSNGAFRVLKSHQTFDTLITPNI